MHPNWILGNYNDSGTPDDNTQLQLYKKVFPVLWKNPYVKGVTLWGYREGEMWQTQLLSYYVQRSHMAPGDDMACSIC